MKYTNLKVKHYIRQKQIIASTWYDNPVVEAVYENDYHKLKNLLLNGADVNIRGSDNWTALHYAAYFNRPILVRCLDAFSCELNPVTEKANLTPLILASRRGHTEIVKLLIESLCSRESALKISKIRDEGICIKDISSEKSSYLNGLS